MRKIATPALLVMLISLLSFGAVHGQDTTPAATEAVPCDPGAAMAAVSAMLKSSGDQTQDVNSLLSAESYLSTAIAACNPHGKWTAQQVIDAFKVAGLEVSSPGPEKMGIVPYTGKDEIHFIVASLCSDCGGRVFDFGDPTNQKVVAAYYDSIAATNKAFFSWVFQKDNILVQINGQLPAAKAKLYQAALDALQ